MKIILLKDVKKVGKIYETKEVKDGYAKNFLMPNGLAKPVNEVNLKWLASVQNNLEANRKKNEKAANEIAGRLKKINLKVYLKADKEGNIFGSVNQNIIADLLKKEGIEINKSQIGLFSKIKSLGEFEIPIEFGFGTVAKVKLTVLKQEN